MQIMQQVFPRPPEPLQESSEAYDILMNGVAGYPDPSPIFVVGMPRSGSTLVEHILSIHPLAHGAGLHILPFENRDTTVMWGGGGGGGTVGRGAQRSKQAMRVSHCMMPFIC